jgi:predicted ester cyclase
MSTEETKALARQAMERLDQRDLDGVLALYAAGTQHHGFAPQTLDNDGYKQAMSALLTAFPDSRFPVSEIIAEGDEAAVRHNFRGTHQGEFQGIAPTGKQITISSICTLHISNGKVTETWLNADFLGLLQQIGAVPTQG